MKHIIQIANPRGTIFQSIIRNDEQCLELDASFTKVINHEKEQSELWSETATTFHRLQTNLPAKYIRVIHILTNDHRGNLVISKVSSSAVRA